MFTVPKILTTVEAVGLTVRNNAVAYDEPQVIAAGVSEADAQIVGNWVYRLNQSIAEGAVQLGNGSEGWGKITPKSPLILATLFSTTIAGTTYECDISTHWYGTKITLNKAATQKLAQIIALGGSASATAAALAAAGIITLPADIPLAVITALLFLGAGIINVADMCKGVSLVFPWGGTPPVILTPNF